MKLIKRTLPALIVAAACIQAAPASAAGYYDRFTVGADFNIQSACTISSTAVNLSFDGANSLPKSNLSNSELGADANNVVAKATSTISVACSYGAGMYLEIPAPKNITVNGAPAKIYYQVDFRAYDNSSTGSIKPFVDNINSAVFDNTGYQDSVSITAYLVSTTGKALSASTLTDVAQLTVSVTN